MFGAESMEEKMTNQDLFFAIGLPPEKAIAFFESKGYTIGFNWHEVWQEAHTKAFTVAGILKQDVLVDIHQSLLEAQKTGIPQKQWEKSISKILYEKGWLGAEADLLTDEQGELLGKRLTPHRLNTIYQTNMRMSERAAEYQAMKEIAHLRPYWRYVAMDGARPTHAALHNSVYPADDPFWDTFYPPNGWNCRCKVYAVKARDIEREDGWQLRKTSEEDFEVYTQNVGGVERLMKAYKLPNGSLFKTDAGFNYSVGKSHLAHLGQAMLEKGISTPPHIAAVAINETFKHPKLMQAVKNAFAVEVANVAKNLEQGIARPQGKIYHIGALLPEVVVALAYENVALESAIISIEDRVIYHALRDDKAHRKQGDKRLPVLFWESLPEMLLKPIAVLRDKTSRNLELKENTLLYVYKQPQGKVVIRFNFYSKEEQKRVNMVRSGEIILQMETLKSSQYELIWGSLD